MRSGSDQFGYYEYDKGKPEYLLTALCRLTGFQWLKSGGSYIAFSRGWAQNRQADVSQSLIDKWKANLERDKLISLNDAIEMARLRDEQIETVGLLTIQEPLLGNNPYGLRLLGLLTPKQREQALKTGSGWTARLTDEQIAWARKLYGKQEFTEPLRILVTQEKKKGVLDSTLITLKDSQNRLSYPAWIRQRDYRELIKNLPPHFNREPLFTSKYADPPQNKK